VSLSSSVQFQPPLSLLCLAVACARVVVVAVDA
jgi:hypothetical protein